MTKGKITLYCGPMFAGKTTKLISHYTTKSLALKPSIDTRYSTSYITTHTGLSIPAVVIGNEAPSGELYVNVLIDEGQFVPDLRSLCLRYSDCGCDVYVAALSGTADQKEWPSVTSLIPVCDEIQFIRATKCFKCMGGEAPFTGLKGGVVKTDTILVGGSEIYVPVCRHCL